MSNPFNLFIATTVVLFLLHRAFMIVRESIVEVAPSATPGNLRHAIVEGALRAGGRLLVLFVTALAISAAITIARHAPTVLASRSPTPADIVRLEPVVVSISADRFDAIRAEATRQTSVAQRRSTNGSS